MDAGLENKLKEIGGMFGITEIPDNIGDLLSSFLGSESESAANAGELPGNGSVRELPEPPAAEQKETASLPNGLSTAAFSQVRHEEETDGEEPGGLGIDPAALIEIMGKLGSVQKNSRNDKKVKLLRALRPFLGKERQEKVDQCVRLMMLSELAPYLKNLGSK